MRSTSHIPGESGESRILPPKQERSRRTLERILDAALEIMEEEGLEAATVSAIVDRAGASVGSFYARFPGKNDLIRHLQTQTWEEARSRWEEALAGREWEDLAMGQLVEGVVSLLIRVLRADHRRRRVLGKATEAAPEGPARAAAFHDHVLSTLTPLFLARRREITHPEPRQAVELGYRFMVGALREVLEWEEATRRRTTNTGPEDLRTDLPSDPGPELGPELARLWLGYLAPGQGSGEEEEEGSVDFFDPWG